MSEGIFTIELGRYGFMLDTAWVYLSISWGLLITTALLLTSYKIYKAINKRRTLVNCRPSVNEDNFWGN